MPTTPSSAAACKPASLPSAANLLRPTFIALLAVLALVGCRTGKDISREVTTESETGPPTYPNRFDEAMKLAYLDYNELAIMGRATYTSLGSESKFAYRVQSKKGEIIWASFSVFGFEGARIIATPDTFLLINRLKKEYIAEGYTYLSDMLGVPVTFYDVEDLLVGNLRLRQMPTADDDTSSPIDFRLRRGKTTLAFNINEQRNIQGMQAFDSTGTRTASLTYSDFQAVEGGLLPHQLFLEALLTKPFAVNMEHRRVQINPSGLNYSFGIPDGYVRTK